MKRTLLSSLFGMLLLFSVSVPSMAASSTRIVINSEVIQTDSPPVILHGHTMVSLASLKSLNITLDWNSKNKTVIAAAPKSKEKLILTVGKKTAKLGEKTLTLESPALLRGGRVVVPLRFISEAFNAEVMWKSTTNTVIIRSSDRVQQYETLYRGTNLAEARKIAADLPTLDTNTLGPTKEGLIYGYHFPEGEALRFYYIQGDLVSYYVIQDDVKRLVWEGVESESGYSKESGERPASEKSEVFFTKDRIDDSIYYGRVGDETPLIGSSPGGLLSTIILPVPNEVRTDQLK